MMTEDNPLEPVKLKAYVLRKQMVHIFLEELLLRFSRKMIEGEFVYDPKVKKDVIFTTPEGYSDLLMFFEEKLFFKTSGTNSQLLAHLYLVRKVIPSNILEIGCEVLFLADGKNYVLVDLTQNGKKATIKSIDHNMLLKVNSNTIKRI